MAELLTAIHDLAKSALHTVLIPVLAVLKALDAGIQHLVTELSKV